MGASFCNQDVLIMEYTILYFFAYFRDTIFCNLDVLIMKSACLSPLPGQEGGFVYLLLGHKVAPHLSF